MEKWSQRLVGAWFGAVATATLLGACQVMTFMGGPYQFAFGDLLSNATLLVVGVAWVGLPLLLAAVILDRRRTGQGHEN